MKKPSFEKIVLTYLCLFMAMQANALGRNTPSPSQPSEPSGGSSSSTSSSSSSQASSTPSSSSSSSAASSTPSTPVTGNASNFSHYFFTPKPVDFTIQSESDLYVSPSCMRRKGIELVILDPGHDDSTASRRSDAKVRGGNGNYTFLWPDVHEGQSNMVSSYLALEYLIAHSKLTAAEARELRTMIRFTRHPGEKSFGDWEASAGYGVRGGTITDGIENRVSRINSMAANHRPYDPSTGSYNRNQKVSVSSKSIMLSVHANSTDYFNEGDHIWIIPPKSGADSALISSLKSAFNVSWTKFFTPLSTDDSTNKSLKNGAASSANLSNIKTGTHSVNLAVLGTSVSMSRKALLEGWVMNGKVGNLANRDMKELPPRSKLEFYRGGTLVKSYDVTEVYKTYAKSIARGLNKYLACGQ